MILCIEELKNANENSELDFTLKTGFANFKSINYYFKEFQMFDTQGLLTDIQKSFLYFLLYKKWVLVFVYVIV